MVKILVKKFDKNIKLPTYKTSGSSGMDLMAYIKNKITINPGKTAMIPTGIAVAIPKNYEIQIRPRSGLAAKKGISVLNTPGTVDADYRGEIKIILINLSKKLFVVKSGDIYLSKYKGWYSVSDEAYYNDDEIYFFLELMSRQTF